MQCDKWEQDVSSIPYSDLVVNVTGIVYYLYLVCTVDRRKENIRYLPREAACALEVGAGEAEGVLLPTAPYIILPVPNSPNPQTLPVPDSPNPQRQCQNQDQGYV